MWCDYLCTCRQMETFTTSNIVVIAILNSISDHVSQFPFSVPFCWQYLVRINSQFALEQTQNALHFGNSIIDRVYVHLKLKIIIQIFMKLRCPKEMARWQMLCKQNLCHVLFRKVKVQKEYTSPSFIVISFNIDCMKVCPVSFR